MRVLIENHWYESPYDDSRDYVGSTYENLAVEEDVIPFAWCALGDLNN